MLIGQKKLAPLGTVTPCDGSDSVSAPSFTAKRMSGCAAIGYCRTWLLTNRKPARPSDRTDQRSVAKSAARVGSCVGASVRIGATRSP